MNSVFPDKIGLVFDPTGPSDEGFPFFDTTKRSLYHICDQLLIYDCVLLRCDYDTIRMIYCGLTCSELEPLLKHKKIRFFAPVSAEKYGLPQLESDTGTLDKDFIERLEECLKPYELTLMSNIKDIGNQIEKYSVRQHGVDNNLSEKIIEKILCTYKEGTNTNFGDWQEIGFRAGIGKILDTWSTGTFNIHFDSEMEHYLKNCTSLQIDFLEKLNCPQDNIIESLHSIGNLPSLKVQIIRGQIGINDLVKRVLSDEVNDLQNWLKKNITPGLDVRDFYYKSLENLPSKSNWVKWLRFGSATALSFILGLFISGNPVLATLLGIGIGSADTASGNKLTELLLDPYHPRDYIGYFKDNLQPNKGN